MTKNLGDRLERNAPTPLAFTNPHLETCSRLAGGNTFVLDRFEVPGLDCHIFSLPHHDAAAGDDLYYVTVCGYRMKSKFVLVDARGLGDAATVLASKLSAVMGRIAGQPDNIELLRAINTRVFHENDTLPALASVVAATYNCREASWTFAYAAHPSMLIQRNGAWSELRAEGETSLPAGMMRESRYDQSATLLHPGDRILIYSDGALDAISQGKAAFAVANLLELASSIGTGTAAFFFQTFIERLVDINKGPDFDNDLTLMLVERKE